MQTRMLLPRSRYDEGVEILSSRLASVPYGDPQTPGRHDGPADLGEAARPASSATSRRVSRRVPTLALGGRRPSDLPKGWYVEPTLFTDVDNSMTIAQEEIFGPVLVVIPFDDDDDAVRIANDSDYGLRAGCSPGRSTGRSPSPGVSAPDRSASTVGAATVGRRALRRLQAQRHRAAERDSRASTSTSRPSPSRGRRRSKPFGRAVSDHDPVLRQHGSYWLRIARSSPRHTMPARSSSTCPKSLPRRSVTDPASSAPSGSTSTIRSSCVRTPCRVPPRRTAS